MHLPSLAGSVAFVRLVEAPHLVNLFLGDFLVSFLSQEKVVMRKWERQNNNGGVGRQNGAEGKRKAETGMSKQGLNRERRGAGCLAAKESGVADGGISHDISN